MNRFSERDWLTALVSDPARKGFQDDIQAAESQIGIYLEVQRAREKSAQNHEYADIYWISRSSIVTSFSALDRLVHAILASHLNQSQFEKIRYRTFQSSNQIDKAMHLIGFQDIFEHAAKHYSKDFVASDRLRELLDSYYFRKNRITHHADTDSNGNRLELSLGYANECCKFVSEFGMALHTVSFST